MLKIVKYRNWSFARFSRAVADRCVKLEICPKKAITAKKLRASYDAMHSTNWAAEQFRKGGPSADWS